jgi:hypothetical protein
MSLCYVHFIHSVIYFQDRGHQILKCTSWIYMKHVYLWYAVHFSNPPQGHLNKSETFVLIGPYMTCLDFCILVTIITILPSFIVFLCKLNYQSIKLGSQDSSVHIALGYGLDERSSIPGRGWEFFSSPLCPDWIWAPPSLPSSGYQGFFP